VHDFLSRLSSDDLTALCFFVLVAIAGLVVWLSLQWRLHRRTEMEIALKRDMLNRGMTVDEIERVIQATSGACQRARGPHRGLSPVGRHERD
jgi:hypothetical protein